VIDDNSPDGTGALADAIAARDRRVSVLHRAAKEGLGRALVHGFRVALAGPYERIYTMDADFSHDPSYLPELRRATESADLAVGTRYVRGGGVVGWGPLRQVVSRGGNFYARTILGVPFHDLTGNYRCWRRAALERIDLDTLRSEGYVFQIEVLYRAFRSGARVREVPIIFRDRRRGKSKMTRRIVMEAWPRVLELRWRALTGRL
jgi:dolichol-phosphate mannosyltransferase